jgi:hypothetical protein
MLDMNRQAKLESLLRQARQQVWDNPDMDKVIIWLKRNLMPYWDDRAANEKQAHDNRMLFLWD